MGYRFTFFWFRIFVLEMCRDHAEEPVKLGSSLWNHGLFNFGVRAYYD